MASHVEISKRLLLINSASSVAVQLLQGVILLWVQWHLLPRISPDEFWLSLCYWLPGGWSSSAGPRLPGT